MSTPSKYLYKVFSRSGTYLGLLPNVTSDFEYNQTINSIGAQLSITVGVSADVSALPVEAITDEAGNVITDESSNPIYIDRQPDIVGSSNPNNLIQNDNQIFVYEYTDFNPNGVCVWQGYIAKFKATYGGANNIIITSLSLGQDMGNLLIPGGSVLTTDNSNTGATTSGSVSNPSAPDSGGQTFVFRNGEQFTAVNNRISAITVQVGVVSSPQTAIVRIWNNVAEVTSGVQPLASVTQTISNTVIGEVVFFLSVDLTVLPGNSYVFTLEPAVGNTIIVASTNAVYSGGNSYGWFTYFNGGNAVSFGQSSGIYFKIQRTDGSTSRAYVSRDVSSYILNDLMTQYIAIGGAISIQSGGYTNSGVLATYTYKINTILEGIQKVFELGPASWYYYVDVSLSQLIYKAASTRADNTIIRGRHITTLEIEATKENIVNTVYFSGGDDGTGTSTNIFTKTVDANSVLNNRDGLARLSDNRVSGTGATVTAQLLAQNYINQHNAETYITTVTILASTADLTQFKLGNMVAIAGYGGFVDNLLLQIVGINRKSDSVTLNLGTLPIRSSKKVDSIQSQLTNTQTVNNPIIPS